MNQALLAGTRCPRPRPDAGGHWMPYPAWLERVSVQVRSRRRRAPDAAAPAWRLSPHGTILLAVLLAVMMSLQFLAQPFVWRNWPVDEVMLGWLEVARDRIVVAVL